ncbi:hypothetical protein FHS32_005213 [Streptomyces albaduncus]|uniref:Uncharacterized protein n=1 Tax=Streptomyces griseoloalbus TaxID=67303 RepID=A0A7W8BTH2_9ACTN|nr:hypothetical protein [Streptomyces albaduncus]
MRAAWLLPGGTGPGQTREDTRLAPVGTMTPDGELTTRQGVIPGGSKFAATGAGAMSLQIGVGRAAVQGTLAQGAYPVAVDAPETLTFGDGSAQFDRIDTVVLRVYDGLFDVSGQTLAAVEVVPGAAAESPVAPTLEPACLPLWDVRVPAGASAGVGGIDWGAALTDRRHYTVAVGGIVPRGSLADPGAYDGQYADVDGVLYRWSAASTAWVLYRPPAAPVEVVTTGLTVTSGWALSSFSARRDGKSVSATVYVTRTGPALSADPNLDDTHVCTLPADWRPPGDTAAIAGDGYGFGEARVEADGQIYLRAWSPNVSIGTNANVRITAGFVQ